MAASLPTLSSSFLGQQLSSRGNSKRSTPVGLFIGRVPQCALDTPYGGNIPKFSRMNVWDPYKRLGISRDASEEEVWSSRNYLLDQYANHERSAESIEAAFEKILMKSFTNRKKTKINLKTRLIKKVEESPPWVQNLLSFVELPPPVIIMRRLALFGFMAIWSVRNSAEAGPAFQVCSVCILINDKALPITVGDGKRHVLLGTFCLIALSNFFLTTANFFRTLISLAERIYTLVFICHLAAQITTFWLLTSCCSVSTVIMDCTYILYCSVSTVIMDCTCILYLQAPPLYSRRLMTQKSSFYFFKLGKALEHLTK